MSDPTISRDSPNATSSRALEDGATPSGLRDGQTIGQCGLEAVPASRLVSRDHNEDLKTPDTFGPSTRNLLGSAALQSSLENKLRAQLHGSISCEVIWKRWDTPWGQSLWKPRARVRTITGIDIGLWPSMTSNSPAKNYNEAGNSAGQVALRKIIIALWPTATSRDYKDGSAESCKNVPVNSLLGRAIHLGLYPTIRENESTGSKVPPNRQGGKAVKSLVLAMWSTLRATDGEKGGPRMSFGTGGSPLPSQASTECNLSNAPMENGGGSLHPEFAGWEMGYPPEWLSCADLVTPSSRKSRKLSSPRT